MSPADISISSRMQRPPRGVSIAAFTVSYPTLSRTSWKIPDMFRPDFIVCDRKELQVVRKTIVHEHNIMPRSGHGTNP